MRMLVFFDLPTLTYKQQKAYRKFHKFLDKSGYIMMQESVYCKLVLNGTVAKSERLHLIENKPEEGVVELLIITEKQFAQIEYIVGNKETNKEDSDKRLLIL